MKCFNKAILGRILLTLVILLASSLGVSNAGDWKLTDPKGVVTTIEPRYAEYVLWQLKNPTTPLTFEVWAKPVAKPMPAPVASYSLVNGQYIPLNDAAKAMPIFTTPIRTTLNNVFQSPCANGRCPK